MQLLRARGIESEAQIPFGSLLELIRPALEMLGQIPPPQAAALESALALRPGTAHDRFAVGAATLSLLAAYAERAPVAVLVDDAQWLDGSSAQALLFAIRRLVADPIAVLVAVREGEPSLLDGADLPVLRIGGLTSDEAALLVQGLAPEAALRLHGATAGNPLALLELAADAQDLAFAPEGAPVLVSARIADAFLRRAGLLEPGRPAGPGPGRDQRHRRPAGARAGRGPAGDRPVGAGRRGERGAGDLAAGRGGVPPSAGPVGDLRRRPRQPAPRRAPGARRGPARPGRRPPCLASRGGRGGHRRNGVGGARAGRHPRPGPQRVRDRGRGVRAGRPAHRRRRAARPAAAGVGRGGLAGGLHRPRGRPARRGAGDGRRPRDAGRDRRSRRPASRHTAVR